MEVDSKTTLWALGQGPRLWTRGVAVNRDLGHQVCPATGYH